METENRGEEIEQTQQPNQKFFCLELYPNVTKGNFITFLFVSFATIVFFVFIDSSLSFVLKNFLGVEDNVGTGVGSILFWNEVVIILFSAFWGVISDKIGRRWVYVIGAIFMTIGVVLPPFATSVLMLLLFRLIFSPGAAATSSMLVALLADYPRDDGMNKARGKASGFMGLAAGLGAITALFVFLRIPSLLKNMSTKEAGSYMFLAVGILGVITIVVSFVGLQKNQNTKAHTHESFWRIVVGGLKATSNPVIVLSYISSFAARGDSVIVSSFLPLFIQDYGTKMGIDKTAALTRAGEIAGIVQTFALVFAPLIGIVADKVNRIFLMLIVSILSCVGYAMFGLIQDPYNWSFPLFLAIVTVGVGEMGILVMCQSLLAQNAPDTERGSVSGFFALTGSFGIMIATSVGGYLFDEWREGAPFIIFSIFNGIVVLYSAILMFYQLYKGTFGSLIYKSNNRGYCLVDTQPKMESNNVNGHK